MNLDSTPLGGDQRESETGFLETGTNRLAKDLFLLTAVAALFMVMFMSMPVQVSANRSWTREAKLTRRSDSAGGLVLALHIRRDGRVEVGDRVVSGAAGVRRAVGSLLQEKPDLKDARVVINTFTQTPSVKTSDVLKAISEAGLNRQNFHIRFTEE